MQPAETSQALNLDALRLCGKPRLDSGEFTAIRDLTRSVSDWDALLAMASRHGLTPIFCKNLEQAATDAIESSWRERFKKEFRRNCCRNLALTAELLRVLQAFESHDVCATAYKGPMLAVQAYGDVAMRQFSDLDILVPQAHIPEAENALIGLGYRPEITGVRAGKGSWQIPGQYAYRREAKTMVELHTEYTLRYFPRRLDLEELCTRRELVTLGGRQVLTFSREDTLLLLSVHGSKHFWERLGWIADIAALMQTQRPINWDLVLRRARASQIERMVLLAAGLAAEIFEADLPPQVSDQLKRDGPAQKMIACICKRFLAPAQEQLGIFGRFAFRVRMRGSLFAGVRYATRMALVPTERDRGRHVPFLEPLYALRRPLRLARTYGWRTRAGS
jgi:hypothetical protein